VSSLNSETTGYCIYPKYSHILYSHVYILDSVNLNAHENVLINKFTV